MSTSFSDICDASLPATSQKWYQISQSIVAALETIAILFFIYLHRKSKYLQQSIRKSPFTANNNDTIFYDEYLDFDNDDNIEQEIIIDHIASNTYSVNDNDNDNNDKNNIKKKKGSIGYQSPKLPPNLLEASSINDNDQHSPISKSIDSTKPFDEFSLNGNHDNDDEEEEEEEDDSYYNESQNRYWKLKNKEENNNNKARKNKNKNKNKHKHRETLAMIEANTDNYRIFCILLPIYYQFLGILCLYCIYRMIYMFLLSINIGSNFGEYSNPFNDDEYIVDESLTTKQIINLCGFGLFQYIESTINHIITFWFLQPSSGLKSLKISFIPASLIGDSFVIITNGELDGCMDELAEIMFQFCIPIILALLLFDDSSYWLQLSTELIGDKKDVEVTEEANNCSPNIIIENIENSITKHLWKSKLQESVGRFDCKANFNRVIDQLSMTIPVIKKSDIEFIGDTNESMIGFGSYSSVKKAKLRKNGQLVAIKSLYSFNDENYKYVVEFMREAFLSQRLKHENIVQFKGVLADRPHLCLVYEYMIHGSLFEYLTKDRIKYRNNLNQYYKSISLIKRIKFSIDAAKGIQCLHSHNIIHRDINCRNLLVTNDYKTQTIIIKVCDFGTCRQISKQHFTPSISYDDIIIDDKIDKIDNTDNSMLLSSLIHKQMTTGIGTVAYMAPEILKHIDFSKKLKRENKRDKIEYDFYIDVYSFGCVLYEIMASKELYEDLKTSHDVQQFVLNQQREEISNNIISILQIPNSYCQLMNQCWTHNPSQRPHFKDIIVRLNNILNTVQKRKLVRV